MIFQIKKRLTHKQKQKTLIIIDLIFKCLFQIQRPSSPPEDTINKEMTEAEREKIGSYEEAFEKIKEETGVNSMNVNIK